MKILKPSETEFQVLSVLWRKGPLSARQVLDLLPDGKKRAYTTVLSILQVMEKKGLVSHQREGLTHIFAPKVSKRQVLRPLLRNLLNNIFGGRPAEAVQHLLDEADISAEELAEVRRLLDGMKPCAKAKPSKGGHK